MDTSTKKPAKPIFLAALAFILAPSVALFAPSAASADPTPTEDAPYVAEGVTAQVTPEQQASIAALAAATDGDRRLNVRLALEGGAQDADLIDYATVLVATGGSLSEKVLGVDVKVAPVEQALSAARCAGYSGYNGFFASGHQLGLNSCQTTQVIAVVGTGAGTAGLYSLISSFGVVTLPAAAAVGISAAIAGVGIGFLGICQAFSSNGATYVNSGLPGVLPPNCWGQ